MACTRPLNAYKSPSGKIFFTPFRGAEFIQLPCGQCIGCRLAHSREWAITKYSLQFKYVLAPGLVPLGIIAPCSRVDVQLLRYIRQENIGWCCGCGHCITRVAQVTQLDSKTETIVCTAPPANNSQIALVKGIIPRNLHIRDRKSQQHFLLDSSKKCSPRHELLGCPQILVKRLPADTKFPGKR